MRFLIVPIVLFFLSTFAIDAGAQNRKPPSVEERAKRATEWMTEELGLTAEQIPPVDSINLLFAKTQQVLFQSAEGDRDKIRESMAVLEKEKETALEKVLTSKQMDLFREKSQEMKSKRGGGGPNR